MRANNEDRRGDRKFSQLSIKLILSLTEQLSMHSFDLEKLKVVKALHALGLLKERLYVLNRNIFILFILFYKGIY